MGQPQALVSHLIHISPETSYFHYSVQCAKTQEPIPRHRAGPAAGFEARLASFLLFDAV